MADPFELVEVAAVLIRDPEGRFLVDYNSNWGSFTFPMSKRRALKAAGASAPASLEPPAEAALRAAAEVLGRPWLPALLRPLRADVPPYDLSRRDGRWKRYSFHLFTASITFAPQPLPGHTALWQTRKELQELEPISPTVRKILTAV